MRVLLIATPSAVVSMSTLYAADVLDAPAAVSVAVSVVTFFLTAYRIAELLGAIADHHAARRG